MARVTAVITSYNGADYVRVLIASLLNSADADMEVRAIVIDNGSTDDTSDAARSFGDPVSVIRNQENLRLSVALNQGLRAALDDPDTDYIVLMNDDTEFTDGSLKILVEACRNHPNSLLTPLQLGYQEPHDIDDGAYEGVKCVRPLIEDAILHRPLKDVYPLPIIIAAGMIGTRQVYEEIGMIDPMFQSYGVDDDYCVRARYLGYDLLLVPASHMFHAHGRFKVKKGHDDWLPRWRAMQLGRLLMCLKNPDTPLWRNYLHLTWRTLKNCLSAMGHLWPAGAIYLLGIYLRLVAQYPQVRRTYRAHYDSSKKGKYAHAATVAVQKRHSTPVA